MLNNVNSKRYALVPIEELLRLQAQLRHQDGILDGAIAAAAEKLEYGLRPCRAVLSPLSGKPREPERPRFSSMSVLPTDHAQVHDPAPKPFAQFLCSNFLPCMSPPEPHLADPIYTLSYPNLAAASSSAAASILEPTAYALAGPALSTFGPIGFVAARSSPYAHVPLAPTSMCRAEDFGFPVDTLDAGGRPPLPYLLQPTAANLVNDAAHTIAEVPVQCLVGNNNGKYCTLPLQPVHYIPDNARRTWQLAHGAWNPTTCPSFPSASATMAFAEVLAPSGLTPIPSGLLLAGTNRMLGQQQPLPMDSAKASPQLEELLVTQRWLQEQKQEEEQKQRQQQQQCGPLLALPPSQLQNQQRQQQQQQALLAGTMTLSPFVRMSGPMPVVSGAEYASVRRNIRPEDAHSGAGGACGTAEGSTGPGAETCPPPAADVNFARRSKSHATTTAAVTAGGLHRYASAINLAPEADASVAPSQTPSAPKWTAVDHLKPSNVAGTVLCVDDAQLVVANSGSPDDCHRGVDAGYGGSNVCRKSGSSHGGAAAGDVAGGRSCLVLLAKKLTQSDARTRRLILPRSTVEANLPEIVDVQSYSFDAVDECGQSWQFVLRSWANGSNPKPVYVLEHMSDYLKMFAVSIGDVVGILRASDGTTLVQLNTPAVVAAAAAAASYRVRAPAASGAAYSAATPRPKAACPGRAAAEAEAAAAHALAPLQAMSLAMMAPVSPQQQPEPPQQQPAVPQQDDAVDDPKRARHRALDAMSCSVLGDRSNGNTGSGLAETSPGAARWGPGAVDGSESAVRQAGSTHGGLADPERGSGVNSGDRSSRSCHELMEALDDLDAFRSAPPAKRRKMILQAFCATSSRRTSAAAAE